MPLCFRDAETALAADLSLSSMVAISFIATLVVCSSFSLLSAEV